jgi:phenylacetic acid degradation operon negative regulatory protein
MIRSRPTGPDALNLLLIGKAEDRDAAREALKNAGFGSPLPGVWVAPSGVPIPEEAASAIRLEVSAEDDSGRRLLSESWPLDRTADAYLKFMKTFEPLRGWIGRGERCPTSMPSPRASC